MAADPDEVEIDGECAEPEEGAEPPDGAEPEDGAEPIDGAEPPDDAEPVAGVADEPVEGGVPVADVLDDSLLDVPVAGVVEEIEGSWGGAPGL